MEKKNNWNLKTKFNKHYVGFKAGFFNAFGIQWNTLLKNEKTLNKIESSESSGDTFSSVPFLLKK